MSESTQYAFGDYRLDPETRTLAREGQLVRLMPKDVAVLLALVERRGEVVTRERLLAQVWPGVIVEDCNLARHVATIRQALGDSPDMPVFIETLPKVGYRFVAPVARATASIEPVSPDAPRPSASADLPTPGRELARSTPVAPARCPGGSGSGCDLGALRDAAEALAPAAAEPEPPAARSERLPRVLLGLAVAGLLFVIGWRSLSERAESYGPIRSLAVMPIENLTGDPGLDHVAVELDEMLVNDLGRLKELQVLSRAESRRFRGSTRSARSIGRELDVTGLLEASIVRADARIRVTAQLVDARTDRLVWAEVFETTPEDLLELQALVAAAAAEALGVGAASPAPGVPADSAGRGDRSRERRPRAPAP